MSNTENGPSPTKTSIWDSDVFLVLLHPVLYYRWRKSTRSILQQNPSNTTIAFRGLIETERMKKRAIRPDLGGDKTERTSHESN